MGPWKPHLLRAVHRPDETQLMHRPRVCRDTGLQVWADVRIVKKRQSPQWAEGVLRRWWCRVANRRNHCADSDAVQTLYELYRVEYSKCIDKTEVKTSFVIQSTALCLYLENNNSSYWTVRIFNPDLNKPHQHVAMVACRLIFVRWNTDLKCWLIYWCELCLRCPN